MFNVVSHYEIMRKVLKIPIRYIILLVLAFVMLAHTQMLIEKQFAPELVIIYPPEGTVCVASISSIGTVTLNAPNSIYEYLDPSFFTVADEKGFHVLETGFENHFADYEITISCRAQDQTLISSITISKDNISHCTQTDGGKILYC